MPSSEQLGNDNQFGPLDNWEGYCNNPDLKEIHTPPLLGTDGEPGCWAWGFVPLLDYSVPKGELSKGQLQSHCGLQTFPAVGNTGFLVLLVGYRLDLPHPAPLSLA